MQRIATAVIAATLLVACGSDEAAENVVTTPPRSPIPADIVLDGEPASLFGQNASGDGSGSTDTGPTTVDPGADGTDGETALVDPSVEACHSDDVECPDRTEPREPDVLPPTTEFTPAPVNVAFCATLTDIENRPMPSDEFDQIRVVQVYLAELSPTVPGQIRDEFAQVVHFVDTVVGAGRSGIVDIAIDPGLDAALERIDDHVDASCRGR
jgi:hypothetical protein